MAFPALKSPVASIPRDQKLESLRCLNRPGSHHDERGVLRVEVVPSPNLLVNLRLPPKTHTHLLFLIQGVKRFSGSVLKIKEIEWFCFGIILIVS